MNFKLWLEAQIVANQQPTTGQYLATAAKGVGKAAIGTIPFLGTAVDIASTANKLWQMRQQGQDVTQIILKMMAQQDQGGAPANAFDLDDKIAAMLNDASKLEIAKRIVSKIDNLITQARQNKINPQAANIEAINYITATIGPKYRSLMKQQ